MPTTGDTTTTYYMIPTANSPLLVSVRLIPLIGNPLADLLQPDLKVLVNLGYGSISNGWSQGPANVPTPFGLFPTDINPADVATALANGAVQGVTNAVNDLKTPTLFDTSSLSLFLAGPAHGRPDPQRQPVATASVGSVRRTRERRRPGFLQRRHRQHAHQRGLQ